MAGQRPPPAYAQLELVVQPGITTDAGLQAAIDNELTRRKTAQFAGTITADETINLTGGFGGGILGHGQTETLYVTSLQQNGYSKIVWAGARTGTTAVIRMDRADVVLRDFSIDGATREQIEPVPGMPDPPTVAKAKIGLQIAKAAGVGSGKLHANNIGFTFFEKAIRVGEAWNNLNCDESTIIDLFVNRCDVGVEFVNGQALGWHFWNPRFSGVETCFRYFGGGNLMVYGGLITTECTFLRFEADFPASDPPQHTFGPKSAYVIDGLKVDDGAANSKIVDQETGARYYARIHINSLQLPNDVTWTDDMFHIVGDTILIIDKAHNLQPGCISWDQYNAATTPFVLVMNSTFWHPSGTTMVAEDLFDVSNSTNEVHYKVINCLQLNDTNTIIEDSEPTGDGWVPLDGDL